MRRTGTALAVMSVLALVVGIVLGAAPVQAAQGNAGVKSVQPATNLGINYPAFPTTNQGPSPYPQLTAGPYIVAATYRPAAVTGGTADVFLVFNENILNGLPNDVVNGSGGVSGHGNATFWPTGFSFTGVTVSANTVRLTGASVPPVGAKVRLSKINAVEGTDGSMSSDVSQISIGTGPVITSVAFVTGYGDSTADNDSLLVTFDANVQYGSGDTAGNTFWNTSEFAMTAANTPASHLLSSVVTNTIAIGLNRYNGNAGNHHFRFIKSGVSKLQLEATKVAWAAAATTENSQALAYPIQAPAGQGPFVRAVYYNTLNSASTNDDEIWVVMSAPINPTSFGATIDGSFNTDVDGGGFAIGAALGTVSSANPLDFSSVIKLTGLPAGLTLPAPAGTDLFGAIAGALKNYQGVGAITSAVPILQGPGIIRASYDDRRTSSRADDQLYIWLNETIASAQTTIGLDDFLYYGFNSTGLTLTTDVQGATQRVTISGFTAANYPRPGSRVQAAAPIIGKAIGDVVGNSSGLAMFGGPLAPMILVEDESRPWTLQMVKDDAGTYDRWNAIDGVDSIYVAWSEQGADDSDQYFLFVTKENPANIDASWMNAKLPRAIALGNLHPYVNDGLIRVGILIAPTGVKSAAAITVSMDDTNPDIVSGDQIYILVASADYQGNLSLRFDQGSLANHLFGAFLAGPLCAPRDFISDVSLPAAPDSADWDDDVIHVVGDSAGVAIQHFVYGDPGAIPCSADSVVVYRDAISVAAEDFLGSGPVNNTDGSFTYIALNNANIHPEDTFIYLRSKTGVDMSAPTQIIFTRAYPYVQVDNGQDYAKYIFDPWNPYRIYNKDDYVNLRLLTVRPYVNNDKAPATNMFARSALLHVWADFTRLDLTAGNITGFGTPADSIELLSLGADQVDNDGDWRTFTDLNGNGKWDSGEPQNDDVGLDGVANTGDAGEGDGLPTFGDPYTDENGNGVFDPGETFQDRVNKNEAGKKFAIFDPGEPNLDSQDADEFGWYEVRNNTANTRGTVKQGYALATPNVDGRLWPFSPIKVWLEDNGISRTGPTLVSMPGYVDHPLPFPDGVGPNTEPQGYARTLSHITTHLGDDAAPWDPLRTFRAQIDLKQPTVAEVSGLWKESAPGSNSPVNEIVPGNPLYHLGRYTDFSIATLSDWDVLYNRAQINVGGTWNSTTGRFTGGTWRDLNLDPSVASGAPSNDANGDGFPGAEGYDEDADGTTDFADVHVMAAATDSATAANMVPPALLNCQNDRRDNDNDAFFVYDSYANGGLSKTGGNIGRITWYNIDESTTNKFDDDNDGQTDETDGSEAPENVGYGNGANDDNEDGIVNGEAVAISVTAPLFKAAASYSRLAGDAHRSDLGAGAFSPPGPGVGEGVVYVDAAHIFGTRPLAGNDAKNMPFYANNVAYPEPITKAFEILTTSLRAFTASGGYNLRGTTDSTATMNFNWFTLHGGNNLDLQLIEKINGLTADGTTPYGLRTLAYDKAGNMATAWTEPIAFTFDLEGPTAEIPGCVIDPNPAIEGFPADFADVSPLAGRQIWDSGKHPGTYTLTVTDSTNNSDAAFVRFISTPVADSVAIYYDMAIAAGSNDSDPNLVAHRSRISLKDPSAPFTTTWPFGADKMFAMDNYPYNHQQEWFFAVVAQDPFNNPTPKTSLCLFDATVLDGTAPTVCLSQIGNNTDLRQGAVAPPDSSINVFAYTQNPPLPGRFEDGDYRNWNMGADGEPGVAGVDDDGDGFTDEKDPGLDGAYGSGDDEFNGSNVALSQMNFGATDDYMTRGWVGGLDRKPGVKDIDDDGDGYTDETDYGPDGIPGSGDDEWNGASVSGMWPTGGGWPAYPPYTGQVAGTVAHNRGETDDYRTNDIVEVIFQMNPVGDNPDRGWITFASVHGDTNSVPGQVIDWTEPVKATWNTWGLATGDYNLRAYGIDWEGNSNETTACITTVGIRSTALRAYIQPPVCTGALTYDLYAVHYIHDYEVDKVRFEYTAADSNGCAIDTTAWKLIAIDDVTTPGDPRGDAVLYPPADQMAKANGWTPHDLIQTLVGKTFTNTHYMFWDADGDGYSPRDPVVLDGPAEPESKIIGPDGIFHAADDVIVIGANQVIPEGATLTNFAADEFWAESDGETDGLEASDWIFRVNHLNEAKGAPPVGGHALNRWKISWDVTGLPEGNYVVRAIAIDENNLTDHISYYCYDHNQQDPPEIELVRVDSKLPDANITTLTLPDASTIDVSTVSIPPYINGHTKWIRINAVGDNDTARMKFEYSLDGGVTYHLIPVNKESFYADINGVPGFQAGQDEVFNDLNGNFVYDTGDFFRPHDATDVLETPLGWPLIPLAGLDDNNPLPGDGMDYTAPFQVYLDISALPLLSDVNVLLRVTAYDQGCEEFRAGTADILALIIGENQPPEADVLRVQDLNDNELDTRPPIMDGNGVVTIGANIDTMRVFVTAEDASSVTSVDLFYRLDPACYQTMPENQTERPTDLAVVLDGSASIGAAEWTVEKEGVAAALENPAIIPTDGTVSFTLVQFANNDTLIWIPLTHVTSSTVAANLATRVRAMTQLMDGTPTALGIEGATASIGAGTNGARQVIIVVTDGVPSLPNTAAEAYAAADAAVAAGIDELDAIGIGPEAQMSFLSNLVRHGTAQQVPSFNDFGTALGSTIHRVIFNSLIEMRQWRSMSADGLLRPGGLDRLGPPDTTYPYDFNVVTDLIDDGVYQYYPRAYDSNGTFNEAPINPWGFKKFALADSNFAFVSTGSCVHGLQPDTAAVGDEFVIHACLADSALAPTTAVNFYFAPRILNEVIPVSQIEPLAPFIMQNPVAMAPILGAATGNGVVLTINGTLGTYHASLANLALPTKYDFTLDGSKVVFAVRPAAGDVILVSYDFGTWVPIQLGDSWAPYTVAWSQANGGVPDPSHIVDPSTNPPTIRNWTGADAYDIIAVAGFDLNHDGTFDPDPSTCDYNEPLASEGSYLFLRDVARPRLLLYGLAFDDFVEPFDYLDLNWPGNPLFRSGDELGGPNYENKLSGIETDVFVKATDSGGGSVVSVKLDITPSVVPAGGSKAASIEMTEISTASDYIDLPITFYEDDYYAFWVTGIEPPAKAKVLGGAESAPIENVILQISVDDGATWSRQYQMVHDAATRSWSANGRFDVGITDSHTQRYQFIVDLVGDQQAAIPDYRNMAPFDDKAMLPFISALNVPTTPFWYTHLNDATQLTNNAFHRVLVTATDAAGNVGTNLNTLRTDMDKAQGPIVFVLDQTPPVVNSITALNQDNQPVAVTRVSPSGIYKLMSNVSDAPFTDINVQAIRSVLYQYTPNGGQTWVTIGAANALSGQWVLNWTPPNTLTDGFDNDGDGLWDEPDEAVSQITIRAIAVDDGLNTGYSDRQIPAVTLTLTVDAAEPSAALTQPVDGQVFPYSASILLVGTTTGTEVPETNDIDQMRFQAKINRFFYIDQVFNGVGHAGVYDNGIDEIWFDVDGSGTWNSADNVPAGRKFAGLDGVFSTPPADPTPPAVLPHINDWFDLDPTPLDNSDNPWLTAANNGVNWEMTWVPNGFMFITVDELGGDEYVRLRMLSHDTAGNWDTEGDLLAPKETVIILNDNTVTRAYITHVGTDDQEGAVDPAETKPIGGAAGTTIYGQMFAPGLAEVVQVNMYLVTNPDGAAPETTLVVMDNTITPDGLFSGLWDASALPDGEYLLFATAVDVDQNESSKHDATKVRVRIDRTPPVVIYTPIDGTSYTGFTNAAPYVDDGIVNHSSMAIVPDAFTGDVNFRVTTTASDVASMVLQWRFAKDPAGLWRPISELFAPTLPENGMFDYEPGQDFTVGGVVHHVWWLHLENFADKLKQTGRMEFRALATDEAGNTNALQDTFAAYTADNLAPYLFDWNDNLSTVPPQVEVGTPINFEISAQDSVMTDGTRTDVVRMVLQDRIVGTTAWTDYGNPVVPTGFQIDSGNAMWVGAFTWTAPASVTQDTQYEFRVLLTDTAGNVSAWSRAGYVVTVEDNAPPDRTKMIDVVARVLVSGRIIDKSPEDPIIWKDLDGNNQLNLGTDWLISEGSLLGNLNSDYNGTAPDSAVGDSAATFPRNVGESYLNDEPHGPPGADRQIVKVARTVTIVGRTQSDDNGIDMVTFLMAPCDVNGNLLSTNPAETDPAKRWITVGVDEFPPGFPLFYWQLFLNTKLYPDGLYKLAAYATDKEGNVEDLTTLDWTVAIIQIDNTGPSAQMDANPTTDAVEKTATVERNRPFTLFARTLKPGTATLENYEDDTVEFFYKRGRDLNMTESWASVPEAAGAQMPDEREDGNPDETRPYSFDVNMAKLDEPTDNRTDVPLSVGEAYDFVAQVGDEVDNISTYIEQYADSTVAGVGTRYIRVLIQDTIAPHLEITSAVRKAAPFGDEDRIENPTQVHAQGFHSITAKLLTGDLDMDHAEFVYREKGATVWNLIDADLTIDDNEPGRRWVLGEWDLQTLKHNTWYEVAAIGVDNVGNVDQNPDIMDVYVDYQAPPFAIVSPDSTTSKWCNGVMDLVVKVTDRGAHQENDDVYDVIWEWKESTWPDIDAPDNSDPHSKGWHTLGVASPDFIYDDATNKYSNTLNLDAMVQNGDGDTDQIEPVFESDLYDLRVRVADHAGNVLTKYVYKNTVDKAPPNYAQISNIKVNGDDTTQDPIDQGQFTDVTSGSMVEIFGTASDNEPDLPDAVDPQTGVFYETMIKTMQFQVAFDLNQDGNADDSTWHDIGVIQLNPPTLGDMSDQTSSILWNTTGLPEGQYLLRVIAIDECLNQTISGSVNVRILDWTPPIARIVAWDADQQPHGVPAPSLVTIYAMAECDQSDADSDEDGWQPRYDVQIQYNVKDANEVVPTGDWVNIGIAVPSPRRIDDFTTQQIWSATVDPMLFGENVTAVWLRALVKDESGNRYGDKPEDVIATVLVNVVKQVDDLGVADGTMTLKQVPAAEMQGGAQMVQSVSWMVESPTNVVLTVKMATSEQAPRVVVLRELANPDEYPSPDHAKNYSPGVEHHGLTRSLDDPTVWRGEINLADLDKDHHDGDACSHYAMWVSGLDGVTGTAQWIDLSDAYMREFTVTTALGTNGTVKVPAYVSLWASVMVPSGAWPDDPACLLVSPTEPPLVSTDQARYLSPIAQTAYHIEIRENDDGFVHGYEPLITIKYGQDQAAAGLTGTEAQESDLTVRRWDPYAGTWTGAGISQIKTFPDENKVVFRVRDLAAIEEGSHGPHNESHYHENGEGNVFQLFAPKQTAPVLVSSIWPNSPYTTDWQTDADPQIVVYLREPGGQTINANEVELLIDDEYWATWLTGEGHADFIRGNGKAELTYANADQTVAELRYSHSTYPRDWLADGSHRLTVRYKAADGTDQWNELKDYVFHVDRKAPLIKFDGGFVSNPRLNNVMGYMNPQHGKLVAKMYDGGTGILFKHDRPWYFLDVDGNGILDLNERQAEPCFNPHDEYGCEDCANWIRVDWGIKYDVWRIHTPDAQPPHDTQHDIDNVEVRTLLHQGTADELEPWLTVHGQPITLDQYNPGTDTLEVPVAVLGGGMIKDNDIIEITWYSDKSIEQNSDGPAWGCTIDTLMIGGQQVLVFNAGCSYDSNSEEMHIYNEGIQDWASNSGSKYVEQRFIVDTSCPTITVLEPATLTVDPAGDLHVVVDAEDEGVGVGPFTVVIMDPSGNVVTPAEGDFGYENGQYHAIIRGPLMNGEYTVRATATDFLGNSCEKVQTVKVESLVLTMTEAVAAPNPFNPAVGTANIHFTVSKGSDVTVKIYDFGGLEVATLASARHYDAGSYTIPWAGEASDHTDLANGAYICRISASDGAKTEEQNLKVVIWRE